VVTQYRDVTAIGVSGPAVVSIANRKTESPEVVGQLWWSVATSRQKATE
jgi:hypothetical protein